MFVDIFTMKTRDVLQVSISPTITHTHSPNTDEYISLKYVPPKLPACKTSFGVMLGTNSGWSLNIKSPLSFLSGLG